MCCRCRAGVFAGGWGDQSASAADFRLLGHHGRIDQFNHLNLSLGRSLVSETPELRRNSPKADDKADARVVPILSNRTKASPKGPPRLIAWKQAKQLPSDKDPHVRNLPMRCVNAAILGLNRWHRRYWVDTEQGGFKSARAKRRAECEQREQQVSRDDGPWPTGPNNRKAQGNQSGSYAQQNQETNEHQSIVKSTRGHCVESGQIS